MSSDKKSHIIATAFELFKKNGFHATGVDLIMREAEVSKRTMYKYFPTKNDLIIAVLEHYHLQYKKHLENLLAQKHDNARDKIKTIFADAVSWFDNVNFHGCLAVNAMAEFEGKDIEIEKACLRFKKWELAVLTELCQDIADKESEQLAFKLFILLEGMSSIAQVSKNPCPIDMVAMSEGIIDRHLQETETA